MSGSLKLFLIILGLVSGALIICQLVMGLLIVNGQASLAKAHQHSGYLTVACSILYLGLSLMVIASVPARKDR